MNETATYDGSGQVRYKHNDRNYKNTGFQVSLQKEWQHHNFELGVVDILKTITPTKIIRKTYTM